MLVFMVGVIVYKLLVYRPLASNPSTRARAQQIANITGAFVNLTIIMILSRVGTVSCIQVVTITFTKVIWYIEDIARRPVDVDFIFEWQNNILRTSAASKIFFLPRENSIHIFKLTKTTMRKQLCENTPLGSRM